MFRLLSGIILVSLVTAGAWFGVRTQQIKIDWHLFPEPLRKVEVEPVARRSITQRIQAPGQLIFAQETRVQAPFSATVSQVLVRDDQTVKAGDILIRLDDSSFQSALKSLMRQRDSIRDMYEASRTQFAQVEKQVQQLEAAYPSPNPAPPELAQLRDQLEQIRKQAERLKADFQQAEESIKNYQKTIDRCVIKAPHAGVITDLNSRVGDIVGNAISTGMMPIPGPGPGVMMGDSDHNALVQVARTDRFLARVWVDESDVSEIRVGQKTEVTVLDFKIRGQVSRVAAVGRRQMESIAFETEITLELTPEKLSRLRAGMSAMVEIDVQSRSETLSVPVQAVVQRRARDVVSLGGSGGREHNDERQLVLTNAALTENEPKAKSSHSKIGSKSIYQADPMRFLRVVYVLRLGQAVAVPVEVGLSDENHVEITSGLKEDDEVIVGPYHELDRLLDHVAVEAGRNYPLNNGPAGEKTPKQPDNVAGIRP